MNIRNELQKVVNLGVPIAFIAKKIGKDPSTLNKWLHGVSNVSKEVELAVECELKRMKAEWDNVM